MYEAKINGKFATKVGQRRVAKREGGLGAAAAGPAAKKRRAKFAQCGMCGTAKSEDIAFVDPDQITQTDKYYTLHGC